MRFQLLLTRLCLHNSSSATYSCPVSTSYICTSVTLFYMSLRAWPITNPLATRTPQPGAPPPVGGPHVRPTYQGRPGSYTIDDISVGGTIDVYGRRFHVVDANGATRRLLEERWGRFEAPAIPFPVDRYTVERKEFMSRQTGCDPNVQHKIIKVRGCHLSCAILPAQSKY